MIENKEQIKQQFNIGMNFLSQKEKTVLALKYFEELTDDEICYCMDIDCSEYGLLIVQAKLKMRSFTSIFDDIDNLTAQGKNLCN